MGGGLCFLLVCLFGRLGLWLVPLGALCDYVALRFNSADGVCMIACRLRGCFG